MKFDRAHSEFANFHEGYVRHYIALADTKAAVILGVGSSIIAYLFAKKSMQELLFNPACLCKSAHAYIVALLLVAGAGCAAWVVAPRLSHTGKGFVYFGAVRRYSSGVDYAARVAGEDESGLTLARLRHSFDISRICWKKYLYLRRSFWLTLAGIIIALPLLK